MNIENDAIVTNLNQERAEIINQIKSKPSIDLKKYCRALGMKREEFLNFVNDLDVEYLVQQILSRQRAHVPFRYVSNSFRVLQKWRRHQCDVAHRGAVRRISRRARITVGWITGAAFCLCVPTMAAVATSIPARTRAVNGAATGTNDMQWR